MQKITKKPLALKMNTMVRKSFAIVLAICILLPSFIATAIAADVTDGFSQKASDSGYFCVDDLEKNSDILIKTDTDAVTFVEDAVINGTQSLASAGMAAVTENNPELSGIDSNTMTVAEYTAWQQSNALQNFKKGLSTEAMDFAAKKGITLSDLSFLNRYFYGNYMEETDNNLRNALLQFYSTDVEYLQNQANPFADIAESDWFYDDVLHSFFGGLIKGTSNDTFSPDTTISRGQIITILYRLDGEKNLPDSSEVLPFPDVSNSWYSDAVHWATHEGIINGYNNGKFGPNDPVTREQIAVILWRYAKYAGYEMSTGKTMNMFSFDDASDISEFAIAPMQWAYGHSIINGTSSTTLSPQGYATRAQFAAIICRFCAKAMK